MKKIIITLTDAGRNRFFDVEVPADKPFGRLKKDITDTINGYAEGLSVDPDSVVFFSDRIGRQLGLDETMEEAGIWNGDYVTILEAQR